MIYYDFMTEREKRFIKQNRNDVKRVACTPFGDKAYKVLLNMPDGIICKTFLTSALIPLSY
jgi:hypothetical protein